MTTVTKDRRPLLTNSSAADILHQQLQGALLRYGWAVGEYVVMPDHIHFFAREASGNAKTLSTFVGEIKAWTAKRLLTLNPELSAPVWQQGFFDRLMRSEREWEEKRNYMLDNPVRAGLVTNPNDWPYKGDLDMFRV